MIRRNIILTTAAVCLAASLMLIIGFTLRGTAAPAWVGAPFSCAECCGTHGTDGHCDPHGADELCRADLGKMREPSYEHMKNRAKDYGERLKRLKERRKTEPAEHGKKNTEPSTPLRPEKTLSKTNSAHISP